MTGYVVINLEIPAVMQVVSLTLSCRLSYYHLGNVALFKIFLKSFPQGGKVWGTHPGVRAGIGFQPTLCWPLSRAFVKLGEGAQGDHAQIVELL